MTTNILEIAENSCKHVEIRVYNNQAHEVYLFTEKELIDFVREVVQECATICTEDLVDPRDTIEQKCASKIIQYFGV